MKSSSPEANPPMFNPPVPNPPVPVLLVSDPPVLDQPVPTSDSSPLTMQTFFHSVSAGDTGCTAVPPSGNIAVSDNGADDHGSADEHAVFWCGLK
jgi:hypothetical protein